jgi:hypothetical protein
MTHNLLLLVHLVAVAAWLGANLTQFVVAPRLRRHGAAEARAWSQAAQLLARRYYNVAGAIVLISGIGLVMDGDWKWQGFVLVGIAMVVVGATLGIAVFDRTLRKEEAALAVGDVVTARRFQHTITSVAILDTFLLLVTMLAMIDRWKGAIT